MKRCLVVLFLVLAGCDNEVVDLGDAGCDTSSCDPGYCAARCVLESPSGYFTGACVSGDSMWGPCDCCACAIEWEGAIVLDDTFGECEWCGVMP
jgi:hypothetical protein